MTDTLEKQLYDEISDESDPNTIKQLINQDVDCNLLYFNPSSPSFISPIRLASEKKDYDTLCLLYEFRKSLTKTQLEKYLQFYINHYDPSQTKRNVVCFDYIVSRFLYTRITTRRKPDIFYTLIAGIHDIDGAKRRNQDLCAGSTHKAFIQLRIYTLFQMIIDEIVKPNYENEAFNILEDELLHNLETYYFLDGISQIPVVTVVMPTEPFTEIGSSLNKYYEPIATNLIKKIGKLGVDQEYTIPTGWSEHAVCVSFRCVESNGEKYIRIRVDNPSHQNPEGEHEVKSTGCSTQIRPKVLGQLNINDLDKNFEYFVLLIDSVTRDLSLEEGVDLIYNKKKKIVELITEQIEGDHRGGSRKSARHYNLSCVSWCGGRLRKKTSQDGGSRQVPNLLDLSRDVPFFDVQAQANCFVKCYEPGSWIRFGEKYNKLHKQIILEQQNNANRLVARWKEEYGRSSRAFFKQFNELNINCNINGLHITYTEPLQDQLKMSYQRNLQYMWSDIFEEFHGQLTKNYIPLRLEENKKSIELENIFIKPHILLVADAGCGKTTLCQHATYLWAHEELWKNKFEWVFYIKMRNMNSTYYASRSNKYSLIDIVEQECFQGHRLNYIDKQKLTNNLRNSENILWILDDCDEQNIPDCLISIKQELFSKPYILLASRPYQTYDLKCNIRIEIEPFNDENIQDYIKKYFSTTTEKVTNFYWPRIRSSAHLKEVVQFPACLEIICSLWKTDEIQFEMPMTIAEIYQKMCEHLLRRYLSKFHKQDTSYADGENIYQLPNAIPFTHLELLAFKAAKGDEFTVHGKELIETGGTTSRSVLQIGLLKSENQTAHRILERNKYHFVHPSFQDYLCACYMINALSSIYLRELDKEFIHFTTERENKEVQFTKEREKKVSQFVEGRDEEVIQFMKGREEEVIRFMKEREEEGIRFMKEREEKVIRFMKRRGKKEIQSMKKREEEVIQFISDKKYNRSLQHTFQLFFELKPSMECINQFWLAVDNKPRDLVGIRHCSRIIRWIRPQMRGSPEDNIKKRTTDIVQEWMFNKDRKAHAYGNKYIFEWFVDLTQDEKWWEAWKEDLFIDDLSKRRYFLRDVWSESNIKTLRKIYENISKNNVEKLNTLIRDGPTQRNLEPLSLDPNSFTLDTVSDQYITSELYKEAQRKARERITISDVEEFKSLLTGYPDFAEFNRRTVTSGKETWPLKIAPSLLRNIENEMWELLSQLTKQNVLFYRNFELPIIPVLQSYADSTDQNDNILRSLLISITFSTGCFLTAPLGTEKVIQVHKVRKDDEFTEIRLDEQRWSSLIEEFDETRQSYGYSCFFPHDN